MILKLLHFLSQNSHLKASVPPKMKILPSFTHSKPVGLTFFWHSLCVLHQRKFYRFENDTRVSEFSFNPNKAYYIFDIKISKVSKLSAWSKLHWKTCLNMRIKYDASGLRGTLICSSLDHYCIALYCIFCSPANIKYHLTKTLLGDSNNWYLY